MILFFSNDSVLAALIIVLEPNLFESVMEDLDKKYTPVKKIFRGRAFPVITPTSYGRRKTFTSNCND